MKDLLEDFSAFTPSETSLKASTSSPESVSSSMAKLGSKTDNCNISFYFFSPPEKPKFNDLFVRSISIPKSLTF